MVANDYYFQEQWFIPGHSPAEVYAVLANACLAPIWWRGVYLEATPLGDYREPVVGGKVRVRACGFLPYTLGFTLEALRLEPGRLIEVRAEGDFDGVWQGRLRREDGGTRVDIEWRVTVHKRVIRWFSWLLKPIFAWNHRWTTQRGEDGMIAYLDRLAQPLPAANRGPFPLAA